MNQINIIKPYRWNGAWVFDDADVGLNREPLVAGADVMMDIMEEKYGSDFLVMFSKNRIPGSTLLLRRVKGDKTDKGNGTVYFSFKLMKFAWLCPALFKYFDKSPKKMFIKIIESKEREERYEGYA